MEHAHGPHGASASLNRTALAATWHCLTGCAIGEVLGLVIATALDWGNVASIALAVVLAFFFGYSLTLRQLITGGVSLREAARVARRRHRLDRRDGDRRQRLRPARARRDGGRSR